MRVRCSQAFRLLSELRLDRSLHQTAKEVVGLNEKLSATYESLTFLQRCKKNGLVPNCVDNCINVSLGIKSSSSLEKLLNRTKKGLLNLLIRSKYSDIRKIRSRIKDLEERLLEHQEKLEPIIKLAKDTVQKDSKRTAMSKFNRLRSAHKNSLPKKDRTASNTGQTASTAADRVTIIGDIEVSPTALQALEKGPGFVIAPRISREQLQNTVQTEIAALAYAMRWHSVYNSPSTQSNQTPITEASALTLTQPALQLLQNKQQLLPPLQVTQAPPTKPNLPPNRPWATLQRSAHFTTPGVNHPRTIERLKNKFRDYRQTSNISSRDVMSKYVETSLSKKNKQS